MYKFKLKEIEVGDTEINRGKKTTVSAIDDETGSIEWDVVDVADFSSVYKSLEKAKNFLDTLEKEGKAKDDVVIDGFAEDIAKLFNAFRTHVRKNYPKEYERVSRLKESINEHDLNSNDLDYLEGLADRTENVILKKIVNKLRGQVEEGEGIGYLTPRAFSKNKKSTGAPDIYYYKLGFKPVPKTKPKGFEVKQLFEKTDRNVFQGKRIAAFKEIEERLNQIYPLLSNAKDETAEYYNENPGSYAIVYSTDYIFELLDEIEAKLKQSE
tara:strand:+ start:2997 stop:3800 length:804 start_codon:yes stop_codon:yes gene_type:complete